MQAYTTDRALVRRAVEQILPSGTSAEEQKADRADELMGRRRELRAQSGTSAASGVAGTGPAAALNASAIGERDAELRLIQTELNMMRSFDNLDRGHQGYDTSLALLAVIQSLSDVPGRKTIVFFSEGLPVSPVLSAKLDDVIDAANRANVTTEQKTRKRKTKTTKQQNNRTTKPQNNKPKEPPLLPFSCCSWWIAVFQQPCHSVISD